MNSDLEAQIQDLQGEILSTKEAKDKAEQNVEGLKEQLRTKIREHQMELQSH